MEKILALFLLFSVVSCTVEYPEVIGVRELKISGINVLKKELSVDYIASIYHPNQVAFTMDKISSRIYLDGEYMGKGTTIEDVKIPASDTTDIRISQDLAMINFVKTLKTWKNKEEISLRLECEFHLQADSEFWSIPYSYERTINVKEELKNRTGISW